MKINFDQVFRDFDKNEVVIEGTKLTFGKVVANSLATPLEEDRGNGHEKTLERWKLAMRLYDGGEQEISATEASEIQKRVSKTHPLMLAGQVIEALNG